jgi:hypothetical protein
MFRHGIYAWMSGRESAVRMAGGGAMPRAPVQSRDIKGLKDFDMILPLIDRLQDDGCE